MSYHCCVPNCTSDSRYDKSLSFHRFPPLKKKKLQNEWIIKIRRDISESFQLTSNTRVCSKHFVDDNFKPPDNRERKLLKEDVVPSVFPWSSTTKTRRKIVRHVQSDPEEIHIEDGGEPEVEEDLSAFELAVARAETGAARAEVVAAEAAVFAADALAKAAQEKLAAAQAEIETLKQQLAESVPKIHKFGLERFSSDDSSVKHYTGFPTYEHFCKFYEFVEPSAKQMKYIYSLGVQDSRPSARTMLLIDELFMFLVRLRLGLFEQDLADRFLIHISSVSRKITTWANFLYFMLGSQCIWPSRQQVNQYMPDDFKSLYPSTRVIIDCTELFVQTPSSLLLQSQMYSSYKSKTTLKGLIGIAPHGAVTFVSSLYTGSISDKEITRCCGILDLLEPFDSVMADKGFDIEELLEMHGAKLNLPPFLQARDQFTFEQVLDTKTIAKLRIHVERAIRRIKEFHIFDTEIPLNLLGSINQIYTVICLLTNFQGPLIMKAPA